MVSGDNGYIVRKITGSITKNVFSSVKVKRCRRGGATLRFFDLCNRENRQVIWDSYLRNDVQGVSLTQKGEEDHECAV